MFGDRKIKNRRMTRKEYEEELNDCRVWGRYPRQYINDSPFYKDIIPEPVVNFSLNFKF